MPHNSLNSLILFSLICLTLAGCTQSDDQRRFEDEAFTPPEGITEVSASGEVNPDAEDPDDWRISPMYETLIDVEPVYPNPASFNVRTNLIIDIRSIEAVDQIEIWFFKHPEQPYKTSFGLDQSMITIGPNFISIPASSITGGSGSASDTYRILVLDGRENVITYGDVRVK